MAHPRPAALPVGRSRGVSLHAPAGVGLGAGVSLRGSNRASWAFRGRVGPPTALRYGSPTVRPGWCWPPRCSGASRDTAPRHTADRQSGLSAPARQPPHWRSTSTRSTSDWPQPTACSARADVRRSGRWSCTCSCTSPRQAVRWMGRTAAEPDALLNAPGVSVERIGPCSCAGSGRPRPPSELLESEPPVRAGHGSRQW